MARKEDCICEVRHSPMDFLDKETPELLYDVRCPFHRGPDRGYGYDNNGVPNTRLGNAVGNVVATLVVGGCGLGVVALIVLAFLRW